MTPEELSQRVLDGTSELVVVLGANRCVESMNPAFERQVQGARRGVDFMDLVPPAMHERVLTDLVRAAAGQEVSVTVPHVGPRGEVREYDYAFFPVEGANVAGLGRPRPEEADARAELSRTRAELRAKDRMLDEIQLELTQVPFIDPVTGVWNRLQVFERLTAEWSRCERYQSPLALLLVDVEDLGRVRARDGRALADELLKATARRIKATVRDHDIVGRYGGDRFVIVAVHSDFEGTLSLCRRIHLALENEPVSLEGRVHDVRLCIGGATSRSQGVEILEDLFQVAEGALEDARRAQERVRVATESGL